MSACLVCLGPADGDYHPRCARRLFGTSRVPRIEVDQSSLTRLGIEMGGRVSLSGVQRKLGLVLDGGTLHVGAGTQRFILKPPLGEFEQVPENEHLTLRLARFLRLLLFSWWCGNGDLHLKNLSLLTRTPGEPRLSPCYELLNTAILYPDDPSALPVGGQRRSFTPATWREFAAYGGLPPRVVAFEARRLLKREAKMHELVARSRLDDARREAYVSVMRARRETLAALA